MCKTHLEEQVSWQRLHSSWGKVQNLVRWCKNSVLDSFRISHWYTVYFSTRTNIDEEVAISIPSVEYFRACLTYTYLIFSLHFIIFIKQKKKFLKTEALRYKPFRLERNGPGISGLSATIYHELSTDWGTNPCASLIGWVMDSNSTCGFYVPLCLGGALRTISLPGFKQKSVASEMWNETKDRFPAIYTTCSQISSQVVLTAYHSDSSDRRSFKANQQRKY